MKIVADIDELGTVELNEEMLCRTCGKIRGTYQEVAVFESTIGQRPKIGACECHKEVLIKFHLYTGPDSQSSLNLDEEHVCALCGNLLLGRRQTFVLKTYLQNTGIVFRSCKCDEYKAEGDVEDN